jgi:hypothetical protein
VLLVTNRCETHNIANCEECYLVACGVEPLGKPTRSLSIIAALDRIAEAIEKRDQFERLADDHARLTIENEALKAHLQMYEDRR